MIEPKWQWAVRVRPGCATLLALLASVLALTPSIARAVPSFARQTGQPCVSCHVGGFGPQLTPFGRQFKLMGYTLKAGQGLNAPLSMMLVESFTHTQTAQPDAPASGFSRNDNYELQQASVFLAGRLSDHMGVLAQATYSENGGVLGWDNIDLRYARISSLGAHSVVWGISANNNPTVSDVYNTAPAWSYPYLAPDLAPSAPAQPVLFGALGGQVIGSSAYAMLDGKWYLEAGGYRSLSPAFLRVVNADYGGRITSLAPYARVARTWNAAGGSITVGGFVLAVRRGLVGADVAGNAIALAGPSDRFNDLGIDASYQRFDGPNTYTLGAIYVDERQRLDATFASGGASNLHDTLQSFSLNGSYWYRNTYGVTLAAFADNGSADTLLYGTSGTPNTQGGSVELSWNPFGKADSWRSPWANLRLGTQYIFYNRFSGAVHDIDGAGRNASDNNTLYTYAWLAF